MTKKKTKDQIKLIEIPRGDVEPGEAIYAIVDYILERNEWDNNTNIYGLSYIEAKKMIDAFIKANGLKIPDKEWYKKFNKPFNEPLCLS
jgi:hypothetical protein